MSFITISAFKQKYYYPRNLLIKSKMLANAVCDSQEIELEMSYELKPAFDWIYHRLTSVESLEFPCQHFAEILHLAKHMSIPTIMYDIFNEIRNGNIDTHTLIRHYPSYHGNPLLRTAAVQQIMSYKF